MCKPIIGIVIRSELEQEKSIFKLSNEYLDAIIKAGGIPLLIPGTNRNQEETEKLTEEERNDYIRILSLCDGFLVTGGTTFQDTDQILCEYAYFNDLPYLGICLGMQLLGHMSYFKEAKVVDKTVENKTEINHNQPDKRYVHKNKILKSKLKEILQVEEIEVNSRHQYHIEKRDDFLVSSLSEDGLIEAIEIPNRKFMIGVQWHPESMITYDNRMFSLFKEFIKQCKK